MRHLSIVLLDHRCDDVLHVHCHGLPVGTAPLQRTQRRGGGGGGEEGAGKDMKMEEGQEKVPASCLLFRNGEENEAPRGGGEERRGGGGGGGREGEGNSQWGGLYVLSRLRWIRRLLERELN